MKTLRQDAVRTRNNLLMAAIKIFSEKSFRDATIAEISDRAGTNVAAVNYHFRDKETLYREAWRYAFLQSLEAHPPHGGVPDSAPVVQRLRAQISALLRRITDPDNREFMIVYREMANPTGLLEEVMREEVLPIAERMEGMVREVLGPGVSKAKVRVYATAIMGQCVIVTFTNRLEKPKPNAQSDSWRIEDIESYARHVANFSLAGMQAARGVVEKNGVGGKSSPKKAGRLRPATGGQRAADPLARKRTFK